MLSIIFSASLLTAALACPQHDISQHKFGKRAEPANDWTYEASFNWGMMSENYTLCQTGTKQSPIQLSLTQGLSLNHIPTFDYKKPVSGDIYNWGYGPAFSMNNTGGAITSMPSVTYDNETLYLKGWHIHAPADHSVQGDRSKAELHFVHGDAAGNDRAVFAMRIDPGNRFTTSTFVKQFESIPSFNNATTIPKTLDMSLALAEVNNFNEFWSYQGSLTSPPCTEGIRWFVARNILFVSDSQMQEILRVSTYSARVEQEVWQHQINV
ncbi:carbonic anhydrase [Phlyctema vagabunda]|uniref:Carbonic anhydrase n=1 Tax=Phlyctema vagabunda TaxID=108571 RepID=A0ABR4PUC4_9HELO